MLIWCPFKEIRKAAGPRIYDQNLLAYTSKSAVSQNLLTIIHYGINNPIGGEAGIAEENKVSYTTGREYRDE